MTIPTSEIVIYGMPSNIPEDVRTAVLEFDPTLLDLTEDRDTLLQLIMGKSAYYKGQENGIRREILRFRNKDRRTNRLQDAEGFRAKHAACLALITKIQNLWPRGK